MEWLKLGTAMYHCMHDLSSIFVQFYTYNVQKIETYVNCIALCMRNLHNFIQNDQVLSYVSAWCSWQTQSAKAKENYIMGIFDILKMEC